MNRKEKFLEEKMDEYSFKSREILSKLQPLPEPNEFGSVKLQYQKLRELIIERNRLSFYDGFFYGISCLQTALKKDE